MIIAFETMGGSPERPNEDWVGANPHGVVVLDGVTAPRVPDSGCKHSVTWYTENLGERLLALLAEDMPLAAVLAAAIRDVTDMHRDTCDLSNPGMPSAVVAMLRQRDDAVDYLLLADATIVLETRDGIQVITDPRVDRAAVEARERTTRHLIGTPEHRAAVAEMSVQQLARRNVRGGYWVAAADPKAAKEAVTGTLDASSLLKAVMLTDGASRIVDLFGVLDWDGLLEYLHTRNVRALLRYVRQIERGDPDGERWPRFKTSDDATVATIRL